MSTVFLLTGTGQSAAEILPSLSLLDHTVRVAAALAGPLPGQAQGGSGRTAEPQADAIFIDARHDLMRVRQLAGQLGTAGVPIIAIVTEGGWAAVTASWGTSDVILHTAGPGEVEARIRLAIGRTPGRPAADRTQEVRSGELVIDEATYSARIRGAALDLTFKEFELLKFLAQHPRRVFTRSQLLQEVWGYDYFGGTRTVDVHVRRLRAKLGAGNESLIGTVRNVGYKFVPARAEPRRTGTGRERDGRQPGGDRGAAGRDGASTGRSGGGADQDSAGTGGNGTGHDGAGRDGPGRLAGRGSGQGTLA